MTEQPSEKNEASISSTFTTALVASRLNAAKDASAEILQLVNTPAYQHLMGAVDALSKSENISHAQASEKMIQTVRKLDQAWIEFLMREGYQRIHSNS